MVIAAIFAGGIGSRMGNSDTPKQYLELGTKPVIIHTIEKFFINDKIDEILVLCPKAWVAHTRDLVAKHLPDGKKITVIAGGATRNGTLESAIDRREHYNRHSRRGPPVPHPQDNLRECRSGGEIRRLRHGHTCDRYHRRQRGRQHDKLHPRAQQDVSGSDPAVIPPQGA